MAGLNAPIRPLAPATTADGSSRAIAIVGDADLAAVLGDLVQEDGLHGVAIGSTDAVAESLLASAPVLVVVEVDARVASGMAAVEALSSMPALRSVPLLLYGSDPDRLEAVGRLRGTTGQTMALTMPFELDDFLHAVQRLLKPVASSVSP